MGSLDGKSVLITGAANTVGTAMAGAFLAEGARVAMTDHATVGVRGMVLALGLCTFIEHDVSEEDDWERVVEQTVEQFGTLHILVNNPQRFATGGVTEQSEETMRLVIDHNLLGTMLGVKCAAPAIIAAGGGAIVNVSSVEVLPKNTANSTYVASVWGVRGFTKAAALELGHKGVRVNSVQTDLIHNQAANAGGTRRSASPRQIAKAVLFLASDAASYCMGCELVVDGGAALGEYAPGLPGALPEPGTEAG